jgi:LysR family transcriptional regulator, regulator of the ytmI operon
MEFRHLQTFQAIVRAGNFVKAAEKLDYAQSTITLHIQKLESELGVQLFSRRGQRTELTAAGKALKNHAEQLLYRATQLQQAMSDIVSGEAGALRIGSIEPVASVHLPSVLVSFCQQYPKVRFSLEVGVTQVIAQKVASGALDLAICSSPAANLGLHFELLFEDPIALLLPQSHRLTKQEQIPVKALAGERLLLTEEHCPYREVLEKAMLPYGMNPFTGIEVMSAGALKQMVRYGLGIGVMPVGAIVPLPEQTVMRRLVELEMMLAVGLVTQPIGVVTGSVVQRLAERLKEHLSKIKNPDGYWAIAPNIGDTVKR